MKILIVDDHPMVRKGLMAALSYEEGIEEVAEAANIAEALKHLANKKSDIVIIDLNLGKEDGLDLIAKSRCQNIQAKFVVLTSSIKKEDFYRAKAVGVDGYILKSAFAEDIIYAFKVIGRGKKYFDPELMQYEISIAKDNHGEHLTEREMEVLQVLGKGYSNMQIAESLYISEHTVKKHISSILAKLNLSHRTEAALYINNL